MTVGAVQSGYGTTEYSCSAKENAQRGGFENSIAKVVEHSSEEVQQVYEEAVKTTGYKETERMEYISQVLVRQVENRYNGIANPNNVFGNTVESALQTARELLADLEKPLVPVSQRGENVAAYIEAEKRFYRAFIEKLEDLDNAKECVSEESEDYQQLLEEKINELFVKVQNGDTEPTYQIGANSFTEKEWDEFLEKFDSVQEAIKALMKEEQERRDTEAAKKEFQKAEAESKLLIMESTSCTYPTANPESEDICYITWYSEEGIFCRKVGQTEGDVWSIAFENKEQYDKVMEFVGRFSLDWNLRFAAHENFWTDFLDKEIDVDGFMEFMEGTNKGVPDYSITVGNSMYVDKDKMQWARYLNPLGSRFYTSEEMHRMQMEVTAANESDFPRGTDWEALEERYKKLHPEYNGEKICCEYPGGPLYTVGEMYKLMWEKLLDEMNITEEEYYAQQAEWKSKMGYAGY